MSFKLLSLDDDALRVVLTDLPLVELRFVGATCKTLRVLVAPAILCRLCWERAFDTVNHRARTLPGNISREHLAEMHPHVLETYRGLLPQGFRRRKEAYFKLFQRIELLKKQLDARPLPLTRRLHVEYQSKLDSLAIDHVEAPMVTLHALHTEFHIAEE